MADAPRSNRPTPRTAAAVEAELRRRIRAELAQARGDAEGELNDATLAEIIARAVALALGWHLEAPEHTRNATLSSRTWRPAGGPRGGPPREDFRDRPYEPRGPRERDFRERQPRDDFDERGPREFRERPPRGPYQQRGPRGRDFYEDRDFPPAPPGPPPQRRGFQNRPSGPRRGGGFGPRRPRGR